VLCNNRIFVINDLRMASTSNSLLTISTFKPPVFDFQFPYPSPYLYIAVGIDKNIPSQSRNSVIEYMNPYDRLCKEHIYFLSADHSQAILKFSYDEHLARLRSKGFLSNSILCITRIISCSSQCLH
jgi:hypothetical protein